MGPGNKQYVKKLSRLLVLPRLLLLVVFAQPAPGKLNRISECTKRASVAGLHKQLLQSKSATQEKRHSNCTAWSIKVAL